MMFSSLLAILITLGIVFSLVFEAFRLFDHGLALEFLFGLRWEPQIAMRADQVPGGAFGVIPVFTALPDLGDRHDRGRSDGLLSAISLTEYSHPHFRAVVKPLLEILAGVPTVVFGFFAVWPSLRLCVIWALLGFEASPNSALAAGAVMGVMIIPLISSLVGRRFAAVPRAMREGSYALGATKGETIRKVLLPAALPGIVGGVLLAAEPRRRRDDDRGDGRRTDRELTLNPLDPSPR